MKKLLMDNEKEGVSTVTLPLCVHKSLFIVFTCFSAVSHHGFARNIVNLIEIFRNEATSHNYCRLTFS